MKHGKTRDLPKSTMKIYIQKKSSQHLRLFLEVQAAGYLYLPCSAMPDFEHESTRFFFFEFSLRSGTIEGPSLFRKIMNPAHHVHEHVHQTKKTQERDFHKKNCTYLANLMSKIHSAQPYPSPPTKLPVG